MKNIGKMVLAHKHHIIGALVLSLAIFVALMVGDNMGLGGLTIHPWQLALGLLIAEAGRSLTCFGARYKRPRLEYCGVATQGMSWWVWSLNMPFIVGQQGFMAVLHLAVPLVLLGALPVVAHYATKHWLEVTGITPVEVPVDGHP